MKTNVSKSFYSILKKRTPRFVKEIMIHCINFCRNLIFRIYGPSVLIDAAKAMESINAKYFISSGTLLGIVREGNLIEHDLDLDIGIMPISFDLADSIRLKLVSYGFKHLNDWKLDETLVEQTYYKKGVKLDIFYYFDVNDFTICYAFYREKSTEYKANEFSSIEYSFERIVDLLKLPFNNYYLNAPKNYKTVLENNYGPNWSIKDKKYQYTNAPNAKKINRVGYLIK